MYQRKDSKVIIKNTAWMVFDRIFLLAVNLLVTVKIANYYGSNGYGSYQYAVSIVAIFEILVTFVDGRVVKKRYLNHNPNDIVFIATVSRLIFAGISTFLGAVFLLFYQGGTEFSIMFSVLLINMFVINMRFGMANRFEYLLKSKKIVIAGDISVAISSIMQLIAVSRRWPIIAIAYIALLSSVINIIVLYLQYKREFKDTNRNPLDKELLKELIVESLPLAIAASCAVIYTRCDSVMIGSIMSKSEVGIYAISLKLISIVQIVLQPIRESVFPKMIVLHEDNLVEYKKQYVRVTSLLTWIYICGVLLSFLVLPFCFTFLNPEYSEAYPVYRVHVIGTFFMYNAALRAGHFTLINQGKILMYSQIVSVVLNIILNFFWIRLWGMYGAAYATIVTQGVSLLFSNLFFKKDGREVFKWQVMALNPVYIFMR